MQRSWKNIALIFVVCIGVFALPVLGNASPILQSDETPDASAIAILTACADLCSEELPTLIKWYENDLIQITQLSEEKTEVRIHAGGNIAIMVLEESF